MAVTPISPDNTERWWAIYTVNGHQHRMMVRTLDGQTGSFMSTVFIAVFIRLEPELFSTHIDGMERAVKASNVRNAVPFTGDADYGIGTGATTDDAAKSISFTGRSTGGHKSKFFVYGYKIDSNGDFRMSSAESAPVASVVTLLNGATGTFLAVDGLQPVWHTYGNIDYNDHWERKLRV